MAETATIRQWIAEMRELEKRATPGKWRAVRYLVFAGKRIVADTSEITATAHGGTEQEGMANAKLIAARNTLPALLDCVEALEAALDELGTLQASAALAGLPARAYAGFGGKARTALAKLAEACK